MPGHWIVFQHFFLKLSPLFFEKSLFEKAVLIFIRKDEKCRSSRKMHCCSDLNHVQAKKQKCFFLKMPKCGELHFALKHFLANFLSFWIVWFCTLLLISITYFLLLFTKFGFFLLTSFLPFGLGKCIQNLSNMERFLHNPTGITY